MYIYLYFLRGIWCRSCFQNVLINIINLVWSQVVFYHSLPLDLSVTRSFFFFLLRFSPKASRYFHNQESFLPTAWCTVLRHGHCLKNSLSSCVVLFLLLPSSSLVWKTHVKPFDTIAIKSLALSFLSHSLGAWPWTRKIRPSQTWICELIFSVVWSHSRVHKTTCNRKNTRHVVWLWGAV